MSRATKACPVNETRVSGELSRRRRSRLWRGAQWVAAVALFAFALVGCGSGGAPAPPPPPTTTTVPGTVEDAQALAKIGGARVVIGGKVATSAATTGAFSLEKVPFGTATPPTQPVTVTAAGYRTADSLLALDKDQTVQPAITVPLEPVDPTLTGTIKGKVTSSAGGAGVGGALVSFVFGAGQVIEVRGHTDETGQYVIGGVPSGSVAVTITAAGFLTYGADSIVIADSEGTTPDLNAALTPGTATTTVKGIVVNLETQQAIPGAAVTIAGLPPVTTGQDGKFSIPNVPVGSRSISVTASGFDSFNSAIEVAPGLADLRVELSVTETEPPPVPFTISGTVTVSGAANNAGVTVTATLDATSEVLAQATTPASGAYALWVPAGQYTVRATLGSQTAARTVTVVNLGSPVTGVDFVLAAP